MASELQLMVGIIPVQHKKKIFEIICRDSLDLVLKAPVFPSFFFCTSLVPFSRHFSCTLVPFPRHSSLMLVPFSRYFSWTLVSFSRHFSCTVVPFPAMFSILWFRLPAIFACNLVSFLAIFYCTLVAFSRHFLVYSKLRFYRFFSRTWGISFPPFFPCSRHRFSCHSFRSFSLCFAETKPGIRIRSFLDGAQIRSCLPKIDRIRILQTRCGFANLILSHPPTESVVLLVIISTRLYFPPWRGHILTFSCTFKASTWLFYSCTPPPPSKKLRVCFILFSCYVQYFPVMQRHSSFWLKINTPNFLYIFFSHFPGRRHRFFFICFEIKR